MIQTKRDSFGIWIFFGFRYSNFEFPLTPSLSPMGEGKGEGKRGFYEKAFGRDSDGK
jgi:hypothetical protein